VCSYISAAFRAATTSPTASSNAVTILAWRTRYGFTRPALEALYRDGACFTHSKPSQLSTYLRQLHWHGPLLTTITKDRCVHTCVGVCGAVNGMNRKSGCCGCPFSSLACAFTTVTARCAKASLEYNPSASGLFRVAMSTSSLLLIL
jgi:hypothetical protein